MADYESLLCVKNEVFVYQIPARTSNRGYRAAEWKLDEPDWTGRLKVVAKGRDLSVKLEDKNSGEVFAVCPVEAYPSAVVEQVLDSSRYFVIRIQDGSGRHAFIGLGFADRGDSFDLLVSLQDHFKHVKREESETVNNDVNNISKLDPTPKLDLGFKEGQTIKLNFATKRTGDADNATKARPRGAAAGAMLLPPPPGGSKVIAPPRSAQSFITPPTQATNQATVAPPKSFVPSTHPQSNVDFLLDLGAPSSPLSYTLPSRTQPTASTSASEWDDFTGCALNVEEREEVNNMRGIKKETGLML